MSSRLMDVSSSATAHLYLREDRIRQSYEAMMLAWRTLNADCEALLREKGLGPAHHRILFLTAAHPGITPGVLLNSLGITKQSLGRALGDLRERKLLIQEEDRHDRRKRPLRLTANGEALERELFLMIREVMTRAYREAGMTAVEGFRRVLASLQAPSESCAR
ncbi:MarR family winged helix-turn-helix transcriptional regulator [Gluconobacter sphaericus]|uniref:MarR family transcriptional regulator n=1 Tax=Gluconobacter sphaericus NBRC 12467 TaxID=1307951 RepID=A0AA37SIS8_9PROT|nr:MarR family transcriptional regulator [Gluconobacter sphaericus]MBF0885240.1 MarR family transcriptional regulator [Gluconobacter sphaericus]QQX91190.1 MarR family transcriptional regulator [Gluconobacter sphaericus]GBR55924.1 MarR family transcriptional regulator [Gluconobacter sphaericus NBRC 12467]GEB43092.1 MarR family transcriptional regulator [Gluconobacter sphaericus NBRC 12467]GLQ84447.1 MarR family transcriptional regulator [Gluconobacter sphaericus NBRC 12467]